MRCPHLSSSSISDGYEFYLSEVRLLYVIGVYEVIDFVGHLLKETTLSE